MGKWMDLAARLQSGDNRDNRDNSSPNVPIVPNVPAVLPQSLQEGLLRLQSMGAPICVRTCAWPEVVRDALRLAADGWAQQALALGWSDIDLFGAATNDEEADGLAVWLRGRRLLAVTKDFASAEIAGGRAYFNRANRQGGVLLWEIGNGRS